MTSNEQRPNPEHRLSLQVDAICDRFEAAWISGTEPQIEKFLEPLPGDAYNSLLLKLVKLDLDYHSKQGKSPSPEEYLKRFPEQAASIRKLLNQLRKTLMPDEHAAPQPKACAWPTSGSTSRRIGPYKLLQLIGEGGMGAVYMADQLEPVRRRVALKLIKSGMDSKQVVARFEAERQALAMMDHQNIAKVLDAGITEDGTPYFAMELVQGMPITKYCDREKLSIPDRLKLFVQVCRALQHAHQKGVIHRDIKPTNVLVTQRDGVPVAKVIDFGLAKAMRSENRLTDKTLFTEVGQVCGTLEYMSPEQAEMNELGLDTRTDVYSLGVLLYELLTGSTPLGHDRVRKEAFRRVLELILTEEAPCPSRRLSDSGKAITGISEQRRIEPRRLSGILKRELDWIALKALEKDRSRRYDGAGTLADDVQHYLDGDVVTARPPSTGYRLRKAIRKHKAAFVSGTIFVLLLLAGLIGTGTMWLQSQQDAARASKAEALATNEARNSRSARTEMQKQRDLAQEETRTESERQIAQAVVDFLQSDLLSQASIYYQANYSPTDEVKADLTVREALDRAAKNFAPEAIGAKFPGQPDVQARVLETIASTFSAGGQHDKAVELSDAFMAIRRGASAAPCPPELLEAQVIQLFILVRAQNHVRIVSAFVQLAENVDKVLKLKPDDFLNRPAGFDVDKEIDLRTHRCIRSLARHLDFTQLELPEFQPRWDPEEYADVIDGAKKSVPLVQEVYKGFEKRYGPKDERTLYLLAVIGLQRHGLAEVQSEVSRQMGNVLSRLGFNRPQLGAEASYEKAVEAYDALLSHLAETGDDDIQHASVLIVKGVALMRQGHQQSEHKPQGRFYEEALTCFRMSRSTMRKVVGELHPAVVMNDSLIADTLMSLGRNAEAIPLLTSLVEKRQRLYGPAGALSIAASLARAHYAVGQEYGRSAPNRDLSESIKWFEHALGLYEADKVISNVERATVAQELAQVKLLVRDYAAAERHFRMALDYLAKDHSIDSTTSCRVFSLLAFVHESAGDFPQAAELLKTLIARRPTQTSAKDHPLALSDHIRLADAHRRMGESELMQDVLAQIDRTPDDEMVIHFSHRAASDDAIQEELQSVGWFIADFSSDTQDGTTRFGIEFRRDPVKRDVQFEKQLDPDEFDKLNTKLIDSGFRLVKKQPYESNGETCLAGLWCLQETESP